MNSPYDFSESAALIAKLVALTRDGKVAWDERKIIGNIATRYISALEGNSKALVWSNDKMVGFRVFEDIEELGRKVSPSILPLISPLISERDLISVSIDHENGPFSGELYVNLMSLFELARRSADKIEPKIERVKEYLDRLSA